MAKRKARTWARGERTTSKGVTQHTREIFKLMDVRTEIWGFQEMGVIGAGSQATDQRHRGQVLLLWGDRKRVKARLVNREK